MTVQTPTQAERWDAAAGPQGADVTVIEPKRGWRAIDFRELWRYRELLYFFVWRDMKARFKQTVLGAAWAVIQPVMSMVVFTLIFGNLAKLGPEGMPYPVWVYAGLLPWTFFARAVGHSSLSLASQAHLLTKIYFPRLLVPTAGVGVCLVDFALSFGVYVCIVAGYAIAGMPHLPGLTVALVPVLLLLTVMLAMGVGYVMSSLAVAYRDFRTIIPFMMQVWMYASAVVFTPDKIPAQYRWILAINPMYGVIQGFRSALLNDPPMDWPALAWSAGVAVVLLAFGTYYFRRAERRFADIA